MNNNLIVINAEYLPDVKREEIKETFRVARSSLPELGLVANSGEKGLYKCVFPNGITGALAKAKDGSGNLGTIIDEHGIAGQARWIEQSINPTMMFAAAALHNIEERLDEIFELTKEMFEFEQIKEESQLLADVEFLSQTLRDYQYNIGNQLWMSSKTSTITICENRSRKLINEYKELSINATKDGGLIDRYTHTDDKAKDKVDKTIKFLENYQKAVFLYAFAEYVHVLVTESFDEKYLSNIQGDIEKLSNEYRDVFADASRKIENYSKSSLDLKAIDMAGQAAKTLGELAQKTPLIKNTKTGKSLISGGKSLSAHSDESVDEKIKRLSNYQKAPSHQFVECIKEIRKYHHTQLEMLYDDEYLYFTEPTQNGTAYA